MDATNLVAMWIGVAVALVALMAIPASRMIRDPESRTDVRSISGSTAALGVIMFAAGVVLS